MNTLTPNLSAVASKYLYPQPVSSCQQIPLPPPYQQLPANTFISTLSAVASKYLYPRPISSCQQIPLPPTCQQLPANTFTPTLSAVASEYLYLHPVSSCQPITLPPTCQQLPANTFSPTLSAVFLSFPRFWRTRERLCMSRVKSLLSMRGRLLGYSSSQLSLLSHFIFAYCFPYYTTTGEISAV